ncbi:MAG: site-specific integrase [Chitinophagaceae bacterium]
MINLPNGCRCSQLSVYPKNWLSKTAKITTNWYISYRFYDPNFPKPKLVVVKGINLCRELVERQKLTRDVLSREMFKLVNEAYNPFRSQTNNPEQLYELSSVPLMEALDYAYNKVSVSIRTKRDIKFMLAAVRKAVLTLNLQAFEISKISRKFIRMILEAASYSPDHFNKNRSYLMILYSELCELEAVESNPVRDIKKKKVVKHIRQVLTPEERVKVNQHLQNNYPEFHRFLHIFFHSGARISELLRLKESDVELASQRYKLIVQKGRSYKQVYKTIKDIAFPYWESQLKLCNQGDFIFSKRLTPGPEEIQPYQITKRWYRLVKNKLGISADFYSLKHLHTTEIVDMINEREAARHNEHTTTAMVIGIYDVNREARKHKVVKEINNKFA